MLLQKKSFLLASIFSVFIFTLYFFPLYQTVAQNLETQYKAAVNKYRPDKAGRLAFEIGKGKYRQGNTDEAISYLNQAVKHSATVKDYENLGKTYASLAEIYKNQKNYEQAVFNYKKASKSYELLGDRKKAALYHYLEGNVYAQMKRYDAAIEVYKTTIRSANNANATQLVLQITEDLAKIYRIKGDTKNANLYANIKEEIKDEAQDVIALEERKDEVLIDTLSVSKTEKEEKKKEAEKIAQEQKVKTLSIEELLERSTFESDSLERLHTESLAAREADKKLFMYVVGGVAFFAVILIIFIIIQSNTVRAKKKANRELASANQELASKNEEIESQKEIIEQEKERSEALLLNILPKEIAEELKRNPNLPPRSYDQVSVIFTDFKGFTQVAEELTPEELIDELAECFSEFDSICEKWNLERIKTMGDAYMCAGGIPTTNYTNPVDAVSAAMEMQEVIEQLKQKKMLQGKPYFEMRLGIHTGPVVAGVVGKKRFAYDIWGDTVNLAARMESSGEVGRVNISEYTYSLVRDYFFCSYRGKIEAKNKGEVDMYFVVSKF
ncbi:adenylate/guanylate cyclase domain-containing protein [Bernardetia sp.]|uniref:adenylate/guanylate cyclase domain-containing protein n=1 Tax=Bernardetia sp. TaxID=1937974 RepID=UPI0025C3E566|nr:adenylate/guanylate cyclase domain-containing protein [Bernardetia sp.]